MVKPASEARGSGFRARMRSTWAFFREGRRTPGYSLRDGLHGYVYARWPYLYIGFATGERRLPRWLRPVVEAIGRRLTGARGVSDPAAIQRRFADAYHGKVVSTAAAERLVTLSSPIELHDLEQIIPYEKARDIVLREPDHLVALECPCRSERENPCLPLDVCLIVGEPFAGFVSAHHPDRSHPVTQQEAVEILRAEHERGHVHHAFFKDAMLGRFYAICNCCSCCCGAMQAWRNGTPMLASSGYVCHVSDPSCKGCGVCVDACPFEALSLEDGKASVDRSVCMGCGVCTANCPTGALSLVLAPEKGMPLEMDRLLASARGTEGAVQR